MHYKVLKKFSLPDVLFGKQKKGVERKDKNKAREKFLEWCENQNIPYKTWEHFETQFNQGTFIKDVRFQDWLGV